MCRHCGHAVDFSRREMLATTGVLAMGTLFETALAAENAPAAGAPSPAKVVETPEVRVCYLRPRAKYWLGWPGTSWDPEGYVQKTTKQIQAFADELKVKVSFEPEPLYSAADTDAFIKKIQAEKPQGVIVMPLHMNMWGEVNKISKAGSPTVIFAPLGMCFTGHIAQNSRQAGVYLASCADFDLKPVRLGLKMIRTYNDIHRTKIVVVAGNQEREQKLEPFGLTLRYVPRKTFPDVLKTIGDTDEVKAMAADFKKRAAKIVEPSDRDILNAARNYYTALKIIQDNGCEGITMDCLGLVASREIPTPPCMGWCKLMDVGLMGVCEADINAVMSQLLCCKLLDKPGFIQDPVPNTVDNTFIGAHCVCPTRLNGFDKDPEPFILRNHAESALGVSLQVLFKVGQEVTVMQMMGPARMVLGHGKVLRNLDTPPAGGCRTSVELAIDAPADTRDTKGFHQLFIYGDHRRDFQAYGQMYGIATESI